MAMIDDLPARLDLIVENAGLKCDVVEWKQRSDRWQELAGVYDEIRYALRNAPDTPEGHKDFYDECAQLIFGDTT